ncbi:TetR/AcrR family transcriptional regulator [Streptacidiphilus sp. ASG 303]|uniref:TetR/AcrR family transcriptional regulator n=1 Tax=Streptomycetaceae TaxID=2062 RepID=UPI001E4B3D49|nr:TetR/AcrR family transcriptional regulator [Streptacidiphilus sp. ASG 303]MCD0484172.1 TetR/AcrR family transcriptional regulator [Streptacidiphilus sp. ASG 303]
MTATAGTAPRRRRVTRSPEDRRESLLLGAARVFRDKGFASATVAEVTEAAEVAKGTFYLYFDSKEHLLGALWERYVDRFLETTRTLLDEGGAWWPTLDRLIRALVEHAVGNAELHRIVYQSANGRALELCRLSNQRVVDLMADFVARGTLAGAFSAQDTRLACRLVFHAADGLLDDLISRREDIDLDAVTAAVLELAHRGLGDPEPGTAPA